MPARRTGARSGADIDTYDLAILSVLSEDAGISTIELARRVHLSRTAVARRIANLRDSGILRPLRADIRYDKVGFGIRAFVEVNCTRRSSFEARDRLLERPEVLSLSLVIGEETLVADVIAADTAHLHRFLTWLEPFGETHTKIVLKTHQSGVGFRDRMRAKERERSADEGPGEIPE